MRHIEENTQIVCVRWFEAQYPQLALLLHHSPNGGRRNAIEGARFKAMGTRKGFPDLVLCYPAKHYHGLFIELKTKNGVQRASQKIWQQKVEWAGYKYVICRSVEDFIAEINAYLR